MPTNPLKRFQPSPSTRSFAPLPQFDIPPLPERLSKIAPDDSERWQAAVTDAVRQHFRLLEEKINAIIDGRETTTTTVAAAPATVVKGEKGDKGDKGERGATGATGATGAPENLENLFANILTDGANVLVGSDGNVLTGPL